MALVAALVAAMAELTVAGASTVVSLVVGEAVACQVREILATTGTEGVPEAAGSPAAN